MPVFTAEADSPLFQIILLVIYRQTGSLCCTLDIIAHIAVLSKPAALKVKGQKSLELSDQYLISLGGLSSSFHT